eukprot:974433-Lingulodinium_polyedra.AAC.1
MPRARVRLVERYVGKLGFAQYFKCCCRSVLGRTYQWITFHKAAGRPAGPLWPSLRAELYAAILLLPYCQ